MSNDDFVRSHQRAPLKGAQINDLHRKLLICEESENDTFRFPRSKKPWMGFLRPINNDQRGFTLLEVLAALSVLALGMVILLQTDALNIDRTLHASRLMEATLLAQEKMDEVFSRGEEVTSAGATEGQEDIFSWTRTVAVSQYPGVSEVRLSIDWSEGSRERSYSVIAFLPE